MNRRLLAGILAITASQRATTSTMPASAGSGSPLSQNVRSGQPPSQAQARTAAGQVLPALADMPYTFDELKKRFPAMSAELLKAALDYLIDNSDVEAWGTIAAPSTTYWYMDADGLSDASARVLEKTSTQAQSVSALKKQLPDMKPEFVDAVVAHLLDEGSVIRSKGGSTTDPQVAKAPRRGLP